MTADDPSVPRWLRRRVLWLLVLAAVLAWAADALLRTPVEVLPQFDYPQIRVNAHLPGTSATELEHLVVDPLESRILTLTGLRSVRSVMGNGTAEIDVRFRRGSSAQIDLQAVNGAIDRARGDLPGQVRPVAEILGNAINEVADYTAAIPADIAPARVQRAVVADIVPALRAIPGVQFVNVFGAGNEALWIQPDLDAMRRYGVSVVQIVQAVRSQVLLEPAGYVTLGHNDVLIEARSLPTHIAALERIPVAGRDGPIPLQALARVVRAPEPTHSAVSLDGRPSVALSVIKQPGASTRTVTRAVRAVLDETRTQLPPGVRWVRTYDQGRLVARVGADLGRNLLIGAALAVLILVGALGAGRGIFVLACSIPLSLALAVGALHALGQDLNLMTFGALSVAVGLLADDAILVLESIHHRWESGDAHWQGIRAGVRSIVVPDITGTLTNVAIYVPLLFVGGVAGLFFIPFAWAMIVALSASLLVSLTLIPLGLGFLGARPSAGTSAGRRLLRGLQRANERLFAWVARAPRTSLAITVAVLLISLAALVLVPVDFLPLPNEGALLEAFTLPPGASLLDTRAAARTITRRLLRDPAVAHVYVRIGSASSTTYTEPAYAGEILVALKAGVGVNALDAIGARIGRESQLPGVQRAVDTPTIERVGESLSGLSQPFVLHVFGAAVPELRRLSEEITARLRRIDVLQDVFDNDGYPVTQLQIEPRALALTVHGLTPAALYAQIGPLIGGQVVGLVPQGNVPLDLYLRLADAPQHTVAELAALPIRTQGGWTPLGELARLTLAETPDQIRHIAGARALDIVATPTGPLGSTEAAARRALADLPLPPGYRIAFGGLAAELEQTALGLLLAAAAAFAILVGILLLQFDGLLVPGILLLEIPLALTGGTLALVASGVGLNATGMVGFLTLVGIGLRHSIVLLDRARRNERAGMAVEDAVREAIEVRFRPIVLTAAVAALGMLPTALGLGQGAAPEQGLAVVILGGLVWSALRSTNLIPALYLYWRRKPMAERD